MQLVELELPAVEEEFAGHCWHVDVPVAATAVEYFPSPHGLHASGPGDALYVPASHGVHAAPFTPDTPTLQKQLFKVPLPAAEYVFAGQDEQDGVLPQILT